MSDQSKIPQSTMVESTPDPQIVTLVMALLRHLLTIAATVGLYHGVISDSALYTISGAVVASGMVAWSLYQKLVAAKKDHAGSVASAAAGAALKAK